MKRTLNKQERELTKKGIHRNQSEVDDLKESLALTEKHIEFLKVKREYEDTVRPFNRKKEDMEFKVLLNSYRDQLKIKEGSIDIAHKHLNEGVDKKEHQSG